MRQPASSSRVAWKPRIPTRSGQNLPASNSTNPREYSNGEHDLCAVDSCSYAEPDSAFTSGAYAVETIGYDAGVVAIGCPST